MTFLTLGDVKDHLRILTDDENGLLTTYMDAACEHISGLTGADYSVDVIPASVYAAALLLVADLYENREAQSAAPLNENKTVDRLLFPYRQF